MGIYIHIPFCRRKCFYCGFYSVASDDLKDNYISAVKQEMVLRKDYLPFQQVDTLYFGGGTPSCLDRLQLERLIRALEDTWEITAEAERTIELNPEDANPEKYQALLDLKFNRLSIGVQSFDDSVLKRINRQHSGRQALEAVEKAARMGFGNIGIDIILGLPGSEKKQLLKDMEWISHLPISHISVYILSIDSNSVYEKLFQKGKWQPQEEDQVAEDYLLICDYLKDIGFEHYEISNFARDGKYSRHNTAYWQQKAYLGLGASAHSYDVKSRQWNVAQVRKYINSLNKNELLFEKEVLTPANRYNEYVMTSLRTMWGAEEKELEKLAPETWQKVQPLLGSYVENNLMIRQNNQIRLTEKGWLISDRIFSSLFE